MIEKLLTIIIPCKNEEQIIDKTLTYLNNQVDIKNTRVIIADSSDDNTRNIITNSKYENLNIEIIDGGMPSVARNNGAKLSTTPYILFLDADIFLTDEYTLYDILKTNMNTCYDLLTCTIKTEGDKYSFVLPKFNILKEIFFPNLNFVLGGFMIFYRETFNEVGQFDEEVKFAEDFLISQKISKTCTFVSDRIAYTTDRRFRKKGIWYMTKMAILSLINRNNREFFKNDHKYWI